MERCRSLSNCERTGDQSRDFESLYFFYLCRKEICPLNLDVFYYQIIKGFVLVRFVMLGCKM